MSVETSKVQISIDVVDKNSGEAVNHVTRNLESMGAAGAGSGKKVSDGMDHITGHSLNALDRVRQLRDDFGIHLPRSMEKAIASNRTLMTGITATGSALLALGAIQIGVTIFGQVIEGAEKLYHNVLNINAAIEDYSKEVEKTRQEDFGNPHSIETTRVRIEELKREIEAYQGAVAKLKESASGPAAWGLLGPAAQGKALHDRWFAHDINTDVAQKQGMLDKLERDHLLEQRHQQNLLGIEVQHAADVRLAGEAKITAEFEKQAAILRENARYEGEQDRYYGNPAGKNPLLTSGKPSEAMNREYIAGVEADAEKENLRKEQAQKLSDALRSLHQQANDAELSGFAKLNADKKAAEDDFVRHYGRNAQAMADIDRRYAAEARKLVDSQIEHTKQMMKESFDVLEQRAEQAKQIAQEADRAVTQMGISSLSGSARIHAEANLDIASEREKFAQTPGSDPAALARYEAGVRMRESNQAQDLERRNREETEQLESEARAKFLSAEQNQTSAIDEEYRARLSKLRESLDNQMLSEEDYNRRVVAAGQMRDAEMAQSARQAREKMAGEFSRFFSNPTQALKEMGDHMAGEAAAAMVQRLQGRLGGSSGGEHLGLPSGLFNRIAGTPKAPASSTSEISAGAKNISLASAQIYVQNATVGFGGYSAGSALSGTAGMLSGGASSGTNSGVLTVGAAGGSTASPSFAGGDTNVAGVAQQGLGIFGQAKSLFGGSSKAMGDTADVKSLDLSGSFDKNGQFNLGSSGKGGMLGGGGVGSNAMGAFGGALGLYGASQGNGGIGGALSGAMSGMQFGASIAGPLGAGIGAAAGAFLGFMGFGGREKARVYDLRTVRPRIAQDVQAYQTGQMDYLSAYSDMQSLDGEAEKSTKQFGSGGHSYYNDTIRTEIHQAEAKFSAMERAGRSQFTAVAGFAIGTDSVPETGYALIHQKERIMPSDQNERITRAVERSAEPRQMPLQQSGGWTGDLHVHAIDAKGVREFLDDHKHGIRAAVNASLAENSGGSDAYA